VYSEQGDTKNFVFLALGSVGLFLRQRSSGFIAVSFLTLALMSILLGAVLFVLALFFCFMLAASFGFIAVGGKALVLVRVLFGLVLLAFALFCCFGFLASGEIPESALTWRIGYGIAFTLSIFGIWSLLKKGASAS